MMQLGDRVSDPRGALAVLILALAFLAYAAALFALGGPPLAVVHAFAAFVVLAVVAAAHQLVPVLAGSPVARNRTIWALSVPLTVGFALLVASFQGAPLFAPAGASLFAGTAAWSGWMLVRIARAPREPRTRAAIALALVAFLAAAVLGAGMAFALGAVGDVRWLRFAPSHAVLAVVGFASAFIVTISYRFVPMFGLAHTADGAARFLPALALPPLAACAAVGLSGSAWEVRAAFTFVALALGAFVAVQAAALRRRLRPKLDVSLQYALAAWTLAALGVGTALAATFHPELAPAAVALALPGWIAISILGYAYKIVGFLAWESARRRHPDAKLPPLGNAVDPRLAGGALAALTLGTLAIAAASAGIPLSIAPGAAYAAGVALALAALTRTLVRYRRPPWNPPSTAAGSIRPNRWSASSRTSIA